MKNVVVILLALVVVSCQREYEDDYYVQNQHQYSNQHDAAVAFYESNRDMIKAASNTEELVGYVIKCPAYYTYTSASVVGLSNTINGWLVDLKPKCGEVAVVHTHPQTDNRLINSNRFSLVDLSTAHDIMDVYVQGPDCVVRYATSTTRSVNGQVIKPLMCK